VSLGALITGLGHGLVSWGLGGEDGVVASDEFPATIRIPSARPLFSIRVPSAQPLFTIRIPMPQNRLHIGDTLYLRGLEIVDNRTDELADPDTMTVRVHCPSGVTFDLVYGTAPTSGAEDAIIRDAEGTYTVQVAITAARGTGLYEFSIVTTGARAAEPGEFRVLSRLM
jgi:hypothetical protein